MKLKFVIFLFLKIFSSQSEDDEEIKFKPMPKRIKKDANFYTEKIKGKWYLQAESKNSDFLKKKISEFILDFEEKNKMKISYQEKNEIKETICENKNNGGFFCFLNENFFLKLLKMDLRILKTDYENYLIVGSINNFFWFINKNFGWVLTRDKNVNKTNLRIYMDILEEKTDIDVNDFYINDEL